MKKSIFTPVFASEDQGTHHHLNHAAMVHHLRAHVRMVPTRMVHPASLVAHSLRVDRKSDAQLEQILRTLRHSFLSEDCACTKI